MSVTSPRLPQGDSLDRMVESDLGRGRVRKWTRGAPRVPLADRAGWDPNQVGVGSSRIRRGDSTQRYFNRKQIASRAGPSPSNTEGPGPDSFRRSAPREHLPSAGSACLRELEEVATRQELNLGNGGRWKRIRVSKRVSERAATSPSGLLHRPEPVSPGDGGRLAKRSGCFDIAGSRSDWYSCVPP
jgi:hypothetical protein